MTERMVSEKPASDRKPDGRKQHHGFYSTAVRLTSHVEPEIHRQREPKQQTSRRPPASSSCRPPPVTCCSRTVIYSGRRARRLVAARGSTSRPVPQPIDDTEGVTAPWLKRSTHHFRRARSGFSQAEPGDGIERGAALMVPAS